MNKSSDLVSLHPMPHTALNFMFVTLGGLMFGMDTGVTNGSPVMAQHSWTPTPSDEGLVNCNYLERHLVLLVES